MLSVEVLIGEVATSKERNCSTIYVIPQIEIINGELLDEKNNCNDEKSYRWLAMH